MPVLPPVGTIKSALIDNPDSRVRIFKERLQHASVDRKRVEVGWKREAVDKMTKKRTDMTNHLKLLEEEKAIIDDRRVKLNSLATGRHVKRMKRQRRKAVKQRLVLILLYIVCSLLRNICFKLFSATTQIITLVQTIHF